LQKSSLIKRILNLFIDIPDKRPKEFFLSLSPRWRRLIIVFAIVSLVLHLLMGWFSEGILHPDEYYQIYEFAALKLGLTTANQLPWEYKAEMRPTFQPWMVIGLTKLFRLDNPHLIMAFFRLFSSSLGWITIWYFCLYAIQWFKSDFARLISIFIICFSSILLYFHARFSSENISASCLLAGFIFLLRYAVLMKKRQTECSKTNLVIAGLFFAFAVSFRLQMVLFFPGIFLWTLFVKFNFKEYTQLFLGFATGIFFLIIADSIYYGHLVFSPYNYYYYNMVLGISELFGKLPWSYYLVEGFNQYKISFLLLLVAVIICIWFDIKNLMVASSLPFIIIHFLISHKEMRFLFPVINFIPFVIGMSIDILINKFNATKVNNRLILPSFILIFCLNISSIVLQFSRFSSNDFPIYRYLYDHPLKSGTIVMPWYSLYGESKSKRVKDLNHYIPMKFLKPNLKLKYPLVHFLKDVKKIVDTSKSPIYLVGCYNKKDILSIQDSCQVKVFCVFSNMPSLYKYVDINHWTDRTSFPGLFLLKRD